MKNIRHIRNYVRRGYRLPRYVLRDFYSRAIRAAFYEQPLAAELDINRRANVLVVRTDGLGDLILATPLFKHVKKAFGHPRICLLTRQEWTDLFQNYPYIDEVIPWSIQKYATSVRYRLKFIEALRRRSFDLAIHPVYSREPLSDEVVCCTHASQKVGFDGDLNNISKKQKSKNDRYYTRLIKSTSLVCSEIERNRDFAEQVIGEIIRLADFQPELWLGDADRIAALEILDQRAVSVNGGVVIALFPGASSAYKTWPAANYAELANRLHERFNAKVIVCGAHGDADIASDVMDKVRGPVVNLTGRTSLTQLAAVLKSSDLYIGNDTGPLHMAVAVGIPTLGIMGGGHFGRFYPYGDLNKHRVAFKKMDCYGCNWNCIYDTTRCIQEISVNDVWHEAQRIMEEVVLPSRRHRDTELCNGVTLP
ncbi:MAG TPA: glycosyltransferase family 9 protein [Candidatus Angelobacter sp.]|nr:glycosyltransferase family 9 protein [Candidatus Angelobacter sp.]